MKAMALDTKQVDELVGEGGTCVFMWSTADGHPVGVTMAYVYRMESSGRRRRDGASV